MITLFNKKLALEAPSFSITELRESIHSLVSIGSISSLEKGSAKTFFTDLTFFSLSKLILWLGVFSTVFLSFSFFETSIWLPSTVAKILPSETLSPILTFKSLILPVKVEGISTLDLSLSIVTIVSFIFI